MRIKTALILCAGFGSRLNPLTLKTPKPLLKLNDKTMLEDLIKGCLGHGYHYCHLNAGKIKEFNVTKDINRQTSVVSSVKPGMLFRFGISN